MLPININIGRRMLDRFCGDPRRIGNRITIKDLQKAHIIRVLRSCNGKKKEAAKVLGIEQSTLWRKLKVYKEEVEQAKRGL